MGDRSTEGQTGAPAEIAKTISSYIECLTLQRDARAAGDYYTADARMLGPGMDLDRAALIEGMRAAFDSYPEVRVNRQTLELFVHGDTAYEIARADDTFVSRDGTSATIRNNLFIRWERGEDGAWRFARVLLSPQQSPH